MNKYVFANNERKIQNCYLLHKEGFSLIEMLAHFYWLNATEVLLWHC